MDIMKSVDELGLPINKETCFTNDKNEFKKGIVKQRIKLLKKTARLLKWFLEPEEEILLVVQAYLQPPRQFFLETLLSFFGTHLFGTITEYVFIFTNKRILYFLPPGNSITQINYADIESFKASSKFFYNLVFNYKNGKKEFFQIPRRDLEKIKIILPSLLQKGTTSSLLHEKIHLCPRCKMPLEEGIYRCLNCSLKFKSPSKALILSILVPGGGYFYIRQYLFGLVNAVIEIILIESLIISFVSGKVVITGFVKHLLRFSGIINSEILEIGKSKPPRYGVIRSKSKPRHYVVDDEFIQEVCEHKSKPRYGISVEGDKALLCECKGKPICAVIDKSEEIEESETFLGKGNLRAVIILLIIFFVVKLIVISHIKRYVREYIPTGKIFDNL